MCTILYGIQTTVCSCFLDSFINIAKSTRFHTHMYAEVKQTLPQMQNKAGMSLRFTHHTVKLNVLVTCTHIKSI